MKGLVLKDLYSVKKYLRQYVLFFAVFTVVGIMLKMPAYIGFLGAFYGMSLFISTFNTDEFFHWEAYVLTGPLSRRDLVKGKYVLMILLMGSAAVIAILGELAVCVITKLSVTENFAAGLSMMIYIFLMMSVVIPLIYKFGSEKARTSMILIFVVPVVSVALIGKIAGTENVNEFLEHISWPAVAVGAVILCIMALILSYIISLKIIEKKEF